MGLENYLSNITIEEDEAEDILRHNVESYEPSDGDEEHLTIILRKIREAQLVNLKIRHLDPVFQQIHLCLDNEPQLLEKLLDIVSYKYPESIPKGQIKNSRKIEISEEYQLFLNPPLPELIRAVLHDGLLEEQLRGLGGEEFFQTHYTALYYLRHRFMLNKEFSNGILDIPSSISERLLTTGHGGRSMYLNGKTSTLLKEENELLTKIYPQEDYTPKDAERDNGDIELSKEEIHGAVQAYFDWIKEEGANVFLDKEDKNSNAELNNTDPMFENVTEELKDARKEVFARHQKLQQLITLAEEGDKEKVLSFLSDNDIDPNKLLSNGKTVLMIAAERGHTILADTLINDLKVDIHIAQDVEGDKIITAFSMALSKNQLDVINVFLENGSTISSEESVKLFPIAVKQKNIKLFGLLLKDQFVRYKFIGELGDILAIACLRGDATTVELLLSAGVDANADIWDSRSLIHLAAEFSTPSVFQLLTHHISSVEFTAGLAYPSKFAKYNKHRDSKNIIAQALVKEAEYERSMGYNFTARRLLKKAKQLKEQYPLSGDEAFIQESVETADSKYLLQTTNVLITRMFRRSFLEDSYLNKPTTAKKAKNSHSFYLKIGLLLSWLCFLSTMLFGFAAPISQLFMTTAILMIFPTSSLNYLLFQSSMQNILELFDPTGDLSFTWSKPIEFAAHGINIYFLGSLAIKIATMVNPVFILDAIIFPALSAVFIESLLLAIGILFTFALASVVITQTSVSFLSDTLGKSLSNFIYTKIYGPDITLQNEIKDLQSHITTHSGSTGTMLNTMPPGEAEFTDESLETLLGNYGQFIVLDPVSALNDQLATLNDAEVAEFMAMLQLLDGDTEQVGEFLTTFTNGGTL